MISEILILLVVWLAPIVLLLGLAYFRKWQLARQGRRVPVSDKLLRAPGESLRKKLEELEDELSSGLAMLLTLPLACASIYLISRGRPTAAAGAVGIALAGVPIYAVICWRMLRTIDRQRRCRLGLSGERAVGEELNQLMLEGCRVYHDVPNDPYGNVDHVLVAPSGVYMRSRPRRGAKRTPKGAMPTRRSSTARLSASAMACQTQGASNKRANKPAGSATGCQKPSEIRCRPKPCCRYPAGLWNAEGAAR